MRSAPACTLYDLQHLAFPWFFTGPELVHRAHFYQALCERADAIVAISEFSRNALLGHFDVPVDRTNACTVPDPAWPVTNDEASLEYEEPLLKLLAEVFPGR